MAEKDNEKLADDNVDQGRRRIIRAAAGGVAVSLGGGILASTSACATGGKPVRWGFVGTGGIANSMANVVKLTPLAELTAISSRRMESAEAFAGLHGAQRAFDSWAEMSAWEGIDAVYIATPTSVREEISVVAANNGKHVLGEKPFASLPSMERIIAACRENNVAFMDGTHFVHHPRTAELRNRMTEHVGWPWSVASAFQFSLKDRGNIRFNPSLEPMGAIGDAGWYNMRGAVEYMTPGVALRSCHATLRRDEETGAVISGSGMLVFEDGATSTWNCGFDSGGPILDLRITGANGVVSMGDYLNQDRDNSASYLLRQGSWGARDKRMTVPSDQPGAALMFEDFAAAVENPALRERWMEASLKTQMLLDAAWAAALEAEA